MKTLIGNKAKEKFSRLINAKSIRYGDPDKDYIKGLFQKDNKWVAFDNTTGDCWTEEFNTKKQAMKYLG